MTSARPIDDDVHCTARGTAPDRLAFGPAVVDLCWPEQDAEREDLARRGLPRLLIVERGCTPPWGDAIEDWVRPDADAVERYVRREAVRRRAAARAPAALDADGLLHRGPCWVALPPGELAALTALMAEPGRLVSRADLATAIGARSDHGGGRMLDNVVRRTRRRIAPLGMAVCAVRGAGFRLELGELPASPA
jgi:hypothetical protein